VSADVVEVRVSASSADAEEGSAGGMSLTSSDLEMTYDGDVQTVGIRWPLAVPQGATITAAWVQFTSKYAESGATPLVLLVQAADNAAAFASTAFDISSRPCNPATVAWSPAGWSVGQAVATPSLAALVAAVVARPGWASGNGLCLIVIGSGNRTAWAWDGNAASAPLLHVEFSTGPPVPFTLLTYTIPAFRMLSDTTGCDAAGTLPVSLGLVRIKFWPRYGSPYFMRDKDLAGRAGQPDTLHLPTSPIAGVWLYVLDSDGRVSCESNGVTINAPAVGVGDNPGGQPPTAHRRAAYYDLQGRRVKPVRSGRYFGRDTLVVR
jgi:hypothetical protein